MRVAIPRCPRRRGWLACGVGLLCLWRPRVAKTAVGSSWQQELYRVRGVAQSYRCYSPQQRQKQQNLNYIFQLAACKTLATSSKLGLRPQHCHCIVWPSRDSFVHIITLRQRAPTFGAGEQRRALHCQAPEAAQPQWQSPAAELENGAAARAARPQEHGRADDEASRRCSAPAAPSTSSASPGSSGPSCTEVVATHQY